MKIKSRDKIYYSIWNKEKRMWVRLFGGGLKGSLKAIDEYLDYVIDTSSDESISENISNLEIAKFQTVELHLTSKEKNILKDKLLKEKLKKL